MLTLNDLHDHFAKIPRDFDLIINDRNYKCNKQILFAFSKVISLSESSSSTYSCNIPANEQAINTTINFLHGGNVNFSENSYEIYLIAAHLDISILKPRLCELIEASTTEENFELRYNVLKSFPNYCDPLFLFFIKNKNYFGTFTKSHTLPLSFANAFLASSSSFFNSEDEKADFVLSILSQSDNMNDNDLSIVSNINLCNLNENSLYNILTHQLSSRFSPFLNVFPLFDKQIAIISANEKKLSELKKEANEVQLSCENEKNTNNRLSNEFNSLNSQLFNIDIQHYALKQEINEILDDLKSAKLLLQEIQQLNNEYLPFLKAVAKMQATSTQLVDILQTFYNIGGKTIYPGSSRDALKHSKEWNVECENLRSKIPCIFNKEQLDQYFQALDEAENILISVFPVKNPLIKEKKERISTPSNIQEQQQPETKS